MKTINTPTSGRKGIRKVKYSDRKSPTPSRIFPKSVVIIPAPTPIKQEKKRRYSRWEHTHNQRQLLWPISRSQRALHDSLSTRIFREQFRHPSHLIILYYKETQQ